MNREIALKEVRFGESESEENRRRFRVEAEVTGRLEHPGIVPVYDLGTHPDGRPFYAMRFIRGGNLKSAIQEFHENDAGSTTRNLAFRELLRRFTDVCNAISYAHSRGVIHRDLKPDNIMLGEYGETLVVDWGISQTGNNDSETLDPTQNDAQISPVHTHRTSAGTILGTIEYMSPEQAGSGDEVGPAADIYSLGAVLYEILTGQAPITSRNPDGSLRTPLEMILSVRKGQFAHPTVVKQTTPRALEAIVLKSMALRPTERYRTAKGIADDIQNWLADEPVTAFREPVGVRIRRWVRRNSVLVSTGTMAVTIALIASAIWSSFLAKANDDLEAERTKAVESEKRAVEAKDAAVALKEEAEELEQYSSRVVSSMMSEAFGRYKKSERDAMLRMVESIAAEFAQRLPNNPLVQVRYAEALNEVSKFENARETALKWKAHESPRVRLEATRQLVESARGLEDYSTALALSTEVIELGGTAFDLSIQFKLLLENGQIVAADKLLPKLEEPWLSLATQRRGDLYYSNRDYEAAGKCFEAARFSEGEDETTRVKNADLLVKRSQTRLFAGKTSEAVDATREALRMANAYSHYYVCHLQHCLLIDGKYAEVVGLRADFPSEKLGTTFGAIHVGFCELARIAAGESDGSGLKLEADPKPELIPTWNYDFIDRWAGTLQEEEKQAASAVVDRMKGAFPPKFPQR